jgi:hypothetical protein
LDSRWKFKQQDDALGGCGIQTAALAFGGIAPTLSPTVSAVVEKYDGTSWTAVNSLNTNRYFVKGAGIQTNALAFGGRIPSFSGQQNNMMELIG